MVSPICPFGLLLLLLTVSCIASTEIPSDGEQCNTTKIAEEAPPALLGLPAGEESSATNTDTHKLVLGEGYSLYDKMGPLVINDDGSTRRIANWDVMTDREKQNTLRVLSRRNKVRHSRLGLYAQTVHKTLVRQEYHTNRT
jgi:hypothetical protein